MCGILVIILIKVEPWGGDEVEPLAGRLGSAEPIAKPTLKVGFVFLRLIWKSKDEISVMYLRLLPMPYALGLYAGRSWAVWVPTKLSSPLTGGEANPEQSEGTKVRVSPVRHISNQR